MTTLQELYSSAEEQGILFNVREEEVFTKSGSKVNGKKAIVNDQNGKVVGLVSKSYKTLTNKAVVDSMLESLERSDLSLEGAELKVTTSHGGARAMVDLLLPAHEVRMPGDSSSSILQISSLNSYDGRWKFMSRGGAIRLACANGQILGNFMGSYTSYHTARLDVNEGAKQMVGMLNTFMQAPEWWSSLMKTPVGDDEVIEAIAIYLGVSQKSLTKAEEIEKFRARQVFQDIEKRFVTYTKEFGINAYALYNAFSDYISHREYKKETHGASLLQAQDKFQSILKLPTFCP